MHLKRACKRCGIEFEQPRIQARPAEFCSYKCKLERKRERKNALAHERYHALRNAGVASSVAQPASCSKRLFDALMQEVACRSD